MVAAATDSGTLWARSEYMKNEIVEHTYIVMRILTFADQDFGSQQILLKNKS